MKVSYKVLKKYIPDIKSPQEVATDLIMHTAEVEDIHDQGKDFENIVYGKITSVSAHENADSLKVCMVDIGESTDIQIVCGGSNLKIHQGVAIAKIGASVLWHGQGDPVVMKKTAIRWIDSYGMICASEEIKLKEDFPAKSDTEILDISHIDAKPGTPLAEVLWKDDIILEVDNKAINHRPDLFSHIGIAREISAISGKKLNYDMTKTDFSHLPDLGIKNDIPQIVKRYMWLKVSGVKNIPSPQYIKDLLVSHDIESKGLLIDITNYSLYLYGQPTHCFDAEKLTGNIHIRFAKKDEKFVALNDKTYSLHEDDIVIADEAGVIALGGIIGGKASAVSDSTKTIVIESAWFDQAVVRKTGKRLGIRTDALNVFEKDLVVSIRDTGPSLIIQELKKNLKDIKLESFTDVYESPESHITVPFDLEYINRLIGKNYSETQAVEILETLGITKEKNTLSIPLWRKDLRTKSDIAEEIARIDGYDKIEVTIPRINLGAVSQTPTYRIKKDLRNFLVARGFYDMYNYSFVSETLMKKMNSSTESLIDLKNSLSEDLTHMRKSLLPNLMLSLENNARDFKNLKLFEIGKVFCVDGDTITENYEVSGVLAADSENQYYTTQTFVADICNALKIDTFQFELLETQESYMHSGRSAKILVRGQEVWAVGEIHPGVAKNFGLKQRIGFFTLNINKIEASSYCILKAREVSAFQENNFDINFVVDKSTKAKDIQIAIEKTSPEMIQKVEMFDVYENEEKLPGQRSLSYTVYFGSLEGTLDDTVKNQLIQDIVKRVEKKGGKLR